MEKIKIFIEEIQKENIIDIVIAIGVILLFFIISSWGTKLILRILKVKERDKKKLKSNDIYKGIKSLFLCVGLYIAVVILSLPENAYGICVKIIRVIVILNIARILIGLISPDSKLIKKVKENDRLSENQKAIDMGIRIAKVLIYVIATFIIIADFGYDLNGIIAGLGLSSVVIALAAQELVSNLISGVAIASEKPFEIGDWITVGDISGTVVDIKFRSIKIRTVENTTVTLQNSKVLSEAIINAASINSRRFDLELRLPLDTTASKTEELMKSIKNILESIQEVNEKTIEINVDSIETDAIIIKLFMYVNIVDYNEFLSFKNKVNLCIMKLLENKKIRLAHPSADLYVNKEMLYK